jgi:hypothetical protein
VKPRFLPRTFRLLLAAGLLLLNFTASSQTGQIRPGVLADLDDTGALASLEILDASRKADTLKELPASHAPVELEMA